MYTQRDEEIVILDWFKDQKTGRFLDIGAYDAKVFSNTRALYEKGWSGVLVEPGPTQFVSLLDEYRNNPRVTLVNAAISGNSQGFVPLHHSRDAVSTTDESHREKWSKSITDYAKMYLFLVSYERFIGAFPGPYDFISIDTENTSLNVFRAVVATETGASLICVEFDASANEIVELAKTRGFKEVYRTSENLLLGRK